MPSPIVLTTSITKTGTAYVSEIDTNFTNIKTEFDRISDILTAQQAANATLPLQIFDRNGVIGKSSYGVFAGGLIGGTTITINPGHAINTGFHVSTAASTVLNFAGQPANTYYVYVPSSGVPAISTSALATTICSIVWNGTAFTTNYTDLRVFLFSGSDFANIIASTIYTGYTKQSAAEVIDEKQPRTKLAVTITTADVTLTTAQFHNFEFVVSGTLTGNRNLIIPTIPQLFAIDNITTGTGFGISVKYATSAAVSIPPGHVLLYGDGTTIEVIGTISTGILMPTIPSNPRPTYDSLSDYMSINGDGGLITGFTITENAPLGNGKIDVSAGSAYLRTVDNDITPIYPIDIGLTSGLLMVDGAGGTTINYIYISYNAGTPIVTSSTTLPTDLNTNLLIGNVYRDGTVLHMNNSYRDLVSGRSHGVAQALEETFGRMHASGAAISATGTRNFALTAGKFWYGNNPIATNAFDSSTTGTFTYSYRNGTGGWTDVLAQTQIDNQKYDDGTGTLAFVSVGNYGVHWVYLSTDHHVIVVYGQGNYATLGAAQSAPAIGTLPAEIASHSMLVGRIIIQRNAVTFADISSAFTTTFAISSPTDHNSLSGLQGGLAAEYYHLSQAQYTQAIDSFLSLSVAGGVDVTLSAGQAANAEFEFTGILTGNINVIFPVTTKRFVAENLTTGAFTLTVKTAAGTGITIPQGSTATLYCNGTNIEDATKNKSVDVQAFNAPVVTTFQDADRLGFWNSLTSSIAYITPANIWAWINTKAVAGISSVFKFLTYIWFPSAGLVWMRGDPATEAAERKYFDTYANLWNPRAVTATYAAGVMTYTVAGGHGLLSGTTTDRVTVRGFNEADYNVTKSVYTYISATQFSVTTAGAPASPGTGATPLSYALNLFENFYTFNVGVDTATGIFAGRDITNFVSFYGRAESGSEYEYYHASAAAGTVPTWTINFLKTINGAFAFGGRGLFSTGTVYPVVANTHSLGVSTLPWANVYTNLITQSNTGQIYQYTPPGGALIRGYVDIGVNMTGGLAVTATYAAGVMTYTVASGHGLSSGTTTDRVTIRGFTQTEYNVTNSVYTYISATQFSVTTAGAPASPGTGATPLSYALNLYEKFETVNASVDVTTGIWANRDTAAIVNFEGKTEGGMWRWFQDNTTTGGTVPSWGTAKFTITTTGSGGDTTTATGTFTTYVLATAIRTTIGTFSFLNKAGSAYLNWVTRITTGTEASLDLSYISSINGASNGGFGNLLTNPNMTVAQRGATYALTNAVAYGSIDSWYAYQVTTAAGIFNQVAADASSGFVSYAKLGRTAGNAGTTDIIMGQVLTTSDSIQYAGKQVTISLYAKAGANFSAASSNIKVYLAYGTGTDQSSASFEAGTWTGQTALINSVTQTITTTLTRYAPTTFTVTIPANATQLGLRVSYTPVGTAGADDNLYITGVKIEPGNTPTPVEIISDSLEDRRCRYRARVLSTWVNVSTAPTSFPIEMRAIPVITGGGAGFASTSTTAEMLTCYQTTAAQQTLVLSADL